MPLKFIRIISINVNSIVSLYKRVQFYDFAHSHPADLYFVQETKLDNLLNIHLNGYNIYRADVSRGVGGTAIIGKHGYTVRNFVRSSSYINSTALEIKLFDKWIQFISIYVTHSANTSLAHFQKLFDQRMPTFMGGDFNERHVQYGDISTNRYGEMLHNCISHAGDGVHLINPSIPTCYRMTEGAFIDKFVTINFPHPVSNITNIPSYSDHDAIYIDIHILPPLLTLPSSPPVFNFARAPTARLN